MLFVLFDIVRDFQVIFQDKVVRGSRDTLVGLLGDDKEISISIGDSVTDTGSGGRVGHTLAQIFPMIEFSIYSLVNTQENEFGVGGDFGDDLSDGGYFGGLDGGSLGIGDSISENDDLSGVYLVGSSEFFEPGDNLMRKVQHDFLSRGLGSDTGPIF